MSTAFRYNPCGCGCGLLAQGRFVRGHNNSLLFAPTGMSADRALEIALAVFDRNPLLQERWAGRMRSDR